MYADVGINGVRAQVIHTSEMIEEKGFFVLRKGYNRLFLKKDDVISLRCVTIDGRSIDMCRFKVDLASDLNEASPPSCAHPSPSPPPPEPVLL